jgi:general secretion pathway protein L
LLDLWDYLSARTLVPSQSVSLLETGGRQSRYRVPGFVPIASTRRAGDATAVELPEDLVLIRSLTLPTRAADDIEKAVRLEVEASSPFEPHDTVFGWIARPTKSTRRRSNAAVRIAIASLEQVKAVLDRCGAPPHSEIWVRDGSTFVVIRGFGERRRLERARRARVRVATLVLLAVALIIGIVVTPVVQLRSQVVAAQAQLAQLNSRSGAPVAMRGELIALSDLQRALESAVDGHVDPALVLEQVSELLPDGSWLSLFEYEAGRLRIAGLADNASSLLPLLEERPSFASVHAPSPIAREPASGKERFIIEMELRR